MMRFFVLMRVMLFDLMFYFNYFMLLVFDLYLIVLCLYVHIWKWFIFIPTSGNYFLNIFMGYSDIYIFIFVWTAWFLKIWFYMNLIILLLFFINWPVHYFTWWLLDSEEYYVYNNKLYFETYAVRMVNSNSRLLPTVVESESKALVTTASTIVQEEIIGSTLVPMPGYEKGFINSMSDLVIPIMNPGKVFKVKEFTFELPSGFLAHLIRTKFFGVPGVFYTLYSKDSHNGLCGGPVHFITSDGSSFYYVGVALKYSKKYGVFVYHFTYLGSAVYK